VADLEIERVDRDHPTEALADADEANVRIIRIGYRSLLLRGTNLGL
jgi:hypothetical protein